MVLRLPVTYSGLKYISSHETWSSGFKIGLHDHLNVSATMAVGMGAQRGKAEAKVHCLNLDKSEPPVDSAIILPSKHNPKYFIHYSTTR